MKKYVIGAVALVVGIIGTVGLTSKSSSDEAVRDNVVQLTNADGSSCSGIKVTAPSGKHYVLTAGHCFGLAYPLPDITANPLTEVFSTPVMIIQALSIEGKNVEYLKVLAVDVSYDLMLLESGTNTGVRIADDSYIRENVHTVTHGAGMPLYRTDGEIVTVNWRAGNPFFFTKTLVTARILPGSSGGPLLNENNELVGICTHGDGTEFFGYFATLTQIKAFLKGR